MSSSDATWHVYLIRCRDRSLYAGIALDVPRRLAEHAAGGRRGARYLRGRGPLEVVLDRAVGGKGLALQLERRIKRLPRIEKEALVARPEGVDELLRALAISEQDGG